VDTALQFLLNVLTLNDIPRSIPENKVLLAASKTARDPSPTSYFTSFTVIEALLFVFRNQYPE